MPYAITLCLDPGSAAVIEGLWQTLARSGLDTDRDHLGYAPHITVGIYPDGAPADRLQAVVAQFARQWSPLAVTLSGFGVFPGPSSILWVAPVVTAEMLARHLALQTALSDLAGDAHYHPGAWMPHITLSGVLHDPGPALSALASGWRPLRGQLERLELVRFRPIERLSSYDLNA